MAYREHDGSEHFGARSPRPDHDGPAAPDAVRDEDPERADGAGPSPADEWFGDDFDSGPIAPPPPYAQPQGAAPSPLYPPAPPGPRPESPAARPEPPTALPEPPAALPKPPAARPKPPAALPEPPAALPKPPAARPERVEPAPDTASEPPSDAPPLSPLARNRPQIQRLMQESQRPTPRPTADDVPEPEPLPPLDYSEGAPYRSPAPNAPAPWGAEPPQPPGRSEPPAAAPQSPAEQWGLTPPLGVRPLPEPEARRAAPPPHGAPHAGPPPVAPPPDAPQLPAAQPPAPAAPPVRPQEHRPPPAQPGPAAFGHTPSGGTAPAEPAGFDPGGSAPRREAPASGWRRIVHSATFGLVHPGDSPAELRRRELMDRARTYVVGGHHRVAVLSLKGGVGKTTTTVALGSTLASLRGDRVLAVDANPDRGTLSDKLRLETAATIRDLLREKETISRYADIRGFTSQASSRLEVLASDRDPAVSEAFSEYDYREVSRILEHFYSITLTDCGTGLLHSAMRGVLGLADQIVVVSTPSVDGARSASATLDWLEAHEYGYLVRGGVVVLSMVRQGGRSSVDLRRLEDHFNSRCRSVVQIPWDSHLEEGAEVHLDQLHPATRDAYLELAATVGEAFAWPR